MKKTIKLFTCAVFSVAVFFILALTVFATDAVSTPTLTIEGKNLSYGDQMYIMYAVSGENFDIKQNPVKMLFWTEETSDYTLGTQDYEKTTQAFDAAVGTKSCIIYSNGIAAKEMCDVLYSRAYVMIDGEIYYSEVIKYSVLQYAYDRLALRSITNDQKTLYEAMLKYGGAAQRVLDYKVNRVADGNFYTVSVTDGKLSDGFTSGLYAEGERITITCETPNDMLFKHWVDQNGNVVGTDQTLQVEIGAKNTVFSPYFEPSHFEVIFKDSDGTELKTERVENGSSAPPPLLNRPACCIISWDKAFDKISENTVITATYNFNHSYKNNICEHCGEYLATTDCLRFVLLANGEYSVSFKTGADCPATIVIPETYENKPVTVIAEGAFRDITDISTIVIPKTITTIETRAFRNCSSLSKVIFRENSSLSTIGMEAFAKCGITELTLPDGVTEIGNSAFGNNTALTKVYLPANLMKIGSRAFYNCTALKTISLANTENWHIANSNYEPLEKADFASDIVNLLTVNPNSQNYYVKS